MWEDGLGLGRDVKEGIWKAREGNMARAICIFISGTWTSGWLDPMTESTRAHEWVRREKWGV